jgi:competence protein ComEA
MAVLMMGVWAGAGALMGQAPKSQRAEVREEQRVDINHATLEELLKVPGMTGSWAGRIVRFRPYRSKQDLVDKGVVSGEVYRRIKEYVVAHRERQ